MTDILFSLVSGYGLPVVAISAYVSCLAVPIPTFAVMLASGAFAASGDLLLWHVLAVAYLAAVLGDQTGFQVGRWGGESAVSALIRMGAKPALIAQARDTISTRGGPGVFFSTWLFAPLGPWVNLAAGVSGMPWRRFTLWDMAGEAIWVAGYVSLGYLFGSNLAGLSTVVSDWAGLISSAGITLLLGIFMLRAYRRHRRIEAAKSR